MASRLRKNPIGAPFERSGLVCGVARPRNTASIPAVSRLASEPTSLEMPSRGVLPQPASAQAGPRVHGGIQPSELRALAIDEQRVVDFSVSTNPYGPSPLVVRAIA